MARREAESSWPALAAAGLFGVCVLWGSLLDSRGAGLLLGAPPLSGRWDLRLGVRVLLPVAVGLVLWALSPAMQRLPWARLLPATCAAGLGWAVALALTDGPAGLRDPLTSRDDVLHDLPRVHDVGALLSQFTAHINTYGEPGAWTTHVAGHPPGLLLLLAGLRGLGLPGPWPAALLVVVVGCSAPAAALVTTRLVAGEQTARAAAPFLACAPAAVWIVVSDDALYLGVTAWAVALLALAYAHRSDVLAVTGGLVAGGALFLTYGVLPLGLLLVSVAPRPRVLALGAVGVLTVTGVFAAAGFWWPSGLHETLIRVDAGAGGTRPRSYFLIADVAELLAAVGLAVPVALPLLRRQGPPRVDPLVRVVVPTLLALLVADLSGSARGEVERVWLPFVPWLVVATARLTRPRRWLGAQLLLGLALQVGLRSPW